MAAKYHIGSVIPAVKQASDGLFYWNAHAIGQVSSAYARTLGINAAASLVEEKIGLAYPAASVDVSWKSVDATAGAKYDVVQNEVWSVFLNEGGEAAIRALAAWRAKTRKLNNQTNSLFASAASTNAGVLSDLQKRIDTTVFVRDTSATVGFGVACTFTAPVAAAGFLLGRAGAKIHQGVIENGAKAYFQSGSFGGVIVETAADALFGVVGAYGGLSTLRDKVLVMVIPKIPITVGQGMLEGKTKGQIAMSVLFDGLSLAKDAGLEKLLGKLVPSLSKAQVLGQTAKASGAAPSARVSGTVGRGATVTAGVEAANEAAKKRGEVATGDGSGNPFSIASAMKAVPVFNHWADSTRDDEAHVRATMIVPR